MIYNQKSVKQVFLKILCMIYKKFEMLLKKIQKSEANLFVKIEPSNKEKN
jgi:hypothetical protein